MIKSIWIRGHKSFNPAQATEVPLAGDGHPTFIYGLNGAGKSAIAEVIEGLSRTDPMFEKCRLEHTRQDRYRYVVYNQSFVDRVVRESAIKGIFTVGEMDAERQARIESLETDRQALIAEVADVDRQLIEVQKQIEAEQDRAKTQVYRAYRFGASTKLAGLLTGYGNNAKKFFEALKGHAVPEGTELDSVERLEQRWEDVASGEAEKQVIILRPSLRAAIEGESIWAEPVSVSAESRLAELVAELCNADWVAEGRDYLHTDRCPFCQQGLPADFRDQLAKLIGGSRKAQVDRISQLTASYANDVEGLKTWAESVLAEPLSKESGFELAWLEYLRSCEANLAAMRKKEREPSASVQVKPTNVEGLEAAIARVNAAIEDFNFRIRNRAEEKSRIGKMFFQVLYDMQREAYVTHDGRIAELSSKAEGLGAGLSQAKAKFIAQEGELRDLRRQQKGVDASIDAINDRLKGMGVDAFSIQRSGEDERLYCLHRPGTPDCSPMTLSEGEKTLIAFLYFMELIRGSHDAEEVIDPSKTVVVIDDPISSLSLNYVYDIATMIVRELTKRPPEKGVMAKQTIVLTHNLFFFHELVRQHAGGIGKAHKCCGMLRVIKNQYSRVLPMDPRALLNDYDAWWQVLKDAKERSVPVQVVPVAMRAILEQFLTFTAGSPKIPDAIECLADKDTSERYRSLDRFINRGAHADGVNGPPIDWSDYDVDYLLSKLRAMFVAIDQEEHFVQRMGGNSDAVEAGV